MTTQTIKGAHSRLLIACVILAFANSAFAQDKKKQKSAGPAVNTAAPAPTIAEPKIIGKEIHFADGSVTQADDVWKNGDEFWYRISGVTQRITRSVKSV